MKTLLVYYSRTNVTRNIAHTIQHELDCDIEEITDDNKYNGKIGYLKGGMDAAMGRLSKINPISKNPRDYELVIIGTPVWVSNMASPIYTYLLENKDSINNIASFCTCISSGFEKTLKNINFVSEKTSVAQEYFNAKDVENPSEKINSFINKINKKVI